MQIRKNQPSSHVKPGFSAIADAKAEKPAKSRSAPTHDANFGQHCGG